MTFVPLQMRRLLRGILYFCQSQKMKHDVVLPVRWQEHSAVPSNLQKTLQINQFPTNVLTQFLEKIG